MPHNKNKTVLHLWLQGLLLLTILSIALLMHGWNQWLDFNDNVNQLQQQNITGASSDITSYVKNKQHIAELFVKGNARAITAFVDQPYPNNPAYTQIASRIKYYFPQLLTFFFSDGKGNILFDNFDPQVGDLCASEVKNFIEHDQTNEIYIHPGPLTYHFDIKTPLFNQNGDKTAVFFLNYSPDSIARFLESHRTQGSTLMLLRNDESGLIEIMSTGSRDSFKRDGHLTKEEIQSINYSVEIPATKWQLISLPDTDHLTIVKNDLALQTTALIAVLWLLGLTVLSWKQYNAKLQNRLILQLHDSENRFRQMLIRAPVGFQSMDENGVLLTVNNTWLNIMGYDNEEEVIGHWFGDFLQTDQEALFQKHLEQYKQTDEDSYITYKVLRKNGSPITICLDVRILYDDKQQVNNSLCIITDITKQKDQERIKLNYERQRQAIIDSLPVIIFLQDEDGKYLDVIAGEQSQLYIPRDKIIGNYLHDIFPEKMANLFLDAIHKTLKQNKVNKMEYELDVPKGHSYFAGRVSPMDYTVDGKDVVLVLIIDITEQKSKDQQLHHSMKMDAVGQLTGGIAHDFNNLLSIIIGNLDFIKSKSKNDKGCEPCDSHILNAIEASNRGSDLIKQLLTFARHQQGHTRLVDINRLISKMDTLISRSTTPAIKIEYDLKKNLWHTKLDPGEFENVLLNLTINAHDAMPAGGCLTIKTRNLVLDKTDIKDKTELLPGEYILLCLTDTGSGMSKEVKEKALEPFFSTKEVGKGSGLGLSVVYGFMMSVHGYIEINSELTKGTEICLYLPRAFGKVNIVDEQVDTATVNSDKNLYNSNGESILVVDDEDALLVLAQEQIEEAEYKVYTASNGQQALQLLNQHEDIDLIFSDVIMPGNMSGYELAIKAMELRPQLKILLASGFTGDAIKQKGLALFDAEILNKPYRQEELLKKLREILDA